MKKYILLCFLCFCLYGMSHAQIYIKGYTGYALSTGNNNKLTSYETINEYAWASAYQLKFGQGVNLGLSIGYNLNTNIAFEITGNTQLFTKFKYSKPYQWDFIYPEGTLNWSWSAEGFFGNLEYSCTMFQVSPQVVLKSNQYNRWTFFLKGGLNFIWVRYEETKQTISWSSSVFSDFYVPSRLSTSRYSGNINIGIQYSFGIEYKLSENICVFAELTRVNARYTFKRSEILRYEIDGVDSLSELESIKLNDLDERLIFNHVGLNMGVKYNFR